VRVRLNLKIRSNRFILETGGWLSVVRAKKNNDAVVTCRRTFF
jgi:hypothetical protein